MVAHGDYMLENSEFELYDILADPNEEMDLSNSSASLVDTLIKEFDHWYIEIIESDNLNMPDLNLH